MMKEDKLTLEEAIRLAKKVECWKLVEKIENHPTYEEDCFGFDIFAGYENMIEYRGVFKELDFYLKWHDNSGQNQEYSLIIAISGEKMVDYKKSSKLKTLFDYVYKTVNEKTKIEENKVRLERIAKARSYLKD